MTLTPTAKRLYELLPAIHRIRDAEQGGVLAELLGVIADQVDVLDEELAQLYDDQFIETCAPWVAAYLGDLIGYRVLHGVVPQVASPRAEVANTIAYRRRKGTAAVLEQLARDVTGWPARAIEYFERLATTQYMNHPRPHALATVPMRDHEALAHVRGQGGAFDDLAHTADVRRIAARRPAGRGRHGIRNVGIALWRVQATPIIRAPLVEHADDRRFRFDLAGADTQLFGVPRTEPTITHLAEPFDAPQPLGRRWLGDHLGAHYGPGQGLLLERQVGGGAPVAVPAQDVRICDLSDTSATTWAHEPPAGRVAIDPVLGRVSCGTPIPAGERLLATWAPGQAVPIGAGASSRRSPASLAPQVDAAGGADLTGPLAAVAGGGTVLLLDSDRYQQDVTVTASPGSAGDPAPTVRCVAAAGARPTIEVATALRLDLAPGSTVVLDGLHLVGGPVVLDEVGDTEPRTIVLRHCTLVPGHRRTPQGQPAHPRASLLVLDPFAQVVIDRCVLGPVVAVEGSRIQLVDSAVDAGGPDAVAVAGRAALADGLRRVTSTADQLVGDGTVPAGDVDLAQCTVVGGLHVTRLDASNSILLARLPTGDPRRAAVLSRRRQVGCVRYSWLPEGSRVPRRHRCQPDPDDPAAVRRATKPRFTSLRFGDPAYLQLSLATPDAVRRGADDEGEMGASHLVHAPQREANLALRLDEYLRVGLEAGSFEAT